MSGCRVVLWIFWLRRAHNIACAIAHVVAAMRTADVWRVPKATNLQKHWLKKLIGLNFLMILSYFPKQASYRRYINNFETTRVPTLLVNINRTEFRSWSIHRVLHSWIRLNCKSKITSQSFDSIMQFIH